MKTQIPTAERAEMIRMALCEAGRSDLAQLVQVEDGLVTAPHGTTDDERTYHRASVLIRRLQGRKAACFDCWRQARRAFKQPESCEHQS